MKKFLFKNSKIEGYREWGGGVEREGIYIIIIRSLNFSFLNVEKLFLFKCEFILVICFYIM